VAGGSRGAFRVWRSCAVPLSQRRSVMTTNCLEPLLWMGCVYFAMLAIKRDDPRYWLWFGIVAGIGLEEKYSIAVLGFGIVVGLLLAEQRRVLPGNGSGSAARSPFSFFFRIFSGMFRITGPLRNSCTHQGRRAATWCLSPAAYFRHKFSSVSSDPRADLDHRCAGLSLLRPAESVSVSRLVLSGNLYVFGRSQGQELLLRANLPGLLGSWRGGDREFHRTIAPSLAEARARSVGSRRRSLARASCHAGPPRW